MDLKNNSILLYNVSTASLKLVQPSTRNRGLQALALVVKPHWDANCFFYKTFTPAILAKSAKTWFPRHNITVLNYPTKSYPLTSTENLCKWPTYCYSINHGFINTSMESSAGHIVLMQQLMQNKPRSRIKCISCTVAILFSNLNYFFLIKNTLFLQDVLTDIIKLTTNVVLREF